MNEQEFDKWLEDATKALSVKYSAEDSTTIAEWFRSSDTKDEWNLIGDDALRSFSRLWDRKHFNLYDSLMIRAWFYAPYILALKK